MQFAFFFRVLSNYNYNLFKKDLGDEPDFFRCWFYSNKRMFYDFQPNANELSNQTANNKDAEPITEKYI